MPRKKTPFSDLIGEELIVFLKTTMLTQIDPSGNAITGSGIRAFLVNYDGEYLFLSPRNEDTYNVIIPVSEVGAMRIVTGMIDEDELIGYDKEDVH